jgi:hypothetical protein
VLDREDDHPTVVGVASVRLRNPRGMPLRAGNHRLEAEPVRHLLVVLEPGRLDVIKAPGSQGDVAVAQRRLRRGLVRGLTRLTHTATLRIDDIALLGGCCVH